MSSYTVYIAPLAKLVDLRLPPISNATTIRDELYARGIFVDHVYVVKKEISIPDDIPLTGGYLDALSTMTMEDVAELGRSTHLNKLILNPLANHLHILATTSAVNDFAYYRTDTARIEVIKTEGLLLDSLKSILPAAKTIYKPITDIITEEDARLALANVDNLRELEEVPGNATFTHIYPLGRVRRGISFIVPVRVPVDDDGEDGESQDLVADQPVFSKRKAFFDLRPVKAPSSEGDYSIFRKRQKGTRSVIYCGRPASSDQPIPGSLYHPILSQFHHNLNTCTPTAQDWNCFWRLRNAMTDFYDMEINRREALIAVFAELGIHITPAAIGGFTTDGDIRVAQFFSYIQELKKELSTGGAEPLFEVIGYYLAATEKGMTVAASEYLGFPCILVIQSGSQINVAVAIWSHVPHVETLLSIPLHAHPTNVTVCQAGARFICALRQALPDLELFYKSKSWEERDSQICFPFVRSVGDPHQKIHFRYDSQFNGKRVFRAHSSTDPSQRFIIKFTRRYCEEAHRMASQNGIAPKLYCVHGWKVVVMEDVSAQYVSVDDANFTIGEETQKSIRRAVTLLHQHGFVHGDIRSPNILVRRDGSSISVLIVDFDWAGFLNKAFYPERMNLTDVAWAQGAEPTGAITQEHDLTMMEGMLQAIC